jgi:transcriptional regulator with XRE-family HTH domain
MRQSTAILSIITEMLNTDPTSVTNSLTSSAPSVVTETLPSMNSTNERENFSERLQTALKNAHYSPDSPTRLAREFNVRFEGRPITVHAARKWLVGEAIPTQEKLRMIAQWLGVPADWLRFGGDNDAAANGDSAGVPRFESADVKLISDLQRLDEHHRQLAREFIRMLVRVNYQK